MFFYYQRNLKINLFWDGILVLEIISIFFNFNKINKFQCIFNSLFKKNYKELFKYT